MANRSQRAAIAAETIAILEQGWYETESQRVEIGPLIASAVERSVHFQPADFGRVLAERDQRIAARTIAGPPTFQVVNCTTLAAARGLVDAEPQADPFCLNFASAKNPGGGFLGGSQAQEESLARASGLYRMLERYPEIYDANRVHDSCLYLDHMIYSPRVPVFRDDDDRLLDRPYQVTFLTAPAVNRGAVAKNEPENVPRIAPTMLSRTEKLLSIAAIHGHDTLVLGAWGCGVFRNDPVDVASWFHQHLVQNPAFAGAFRQVVFAVLDRDEKLGSYRAFANRFSTP
jgi:uncharacterized protein (TIGR02452 family)